MYPTTSLKQILICYDKTAKSSTKTYLLTYYSFVRCWNTSNRTFYTVQVEVEGEVEVGYVESVERKVGIDSIGDDSADWELESRDVSFAMSVVSAGRNKEERDMNEFL